MDGRGRTTSVKQTSRGTFRESNYSCYKTTRPCKKYRGAEDAGCEMRMVVEAGVSLLGGIIPLDEKSLVLLWV